MPANQKKNLVVFMKQNDVELQRGTSESGELGRDVHGPVFNGPLLSGPGIGFFS